MLVTREPGSASVDVFSMVMFSSTKFSLNLNPLNGPSKIIPSGQEAFQLKKESKHSASSFTIKRKIFSC